MSEGELKNDINRIRPTQQGIYIKTQFDGAFNHILNLVDEAKKEFLKDFTDDDFFVLKEYGLEDDAKLTVDAIKLKTDILLRWGKQSAMAFLKWFGDKSEGIVCKNPHERIYRGCTSNCKRYENCEAKEK